MTKYIQYKIRILRDLGIFDKIPAEDKQKLKHCKTEIAADNVARTLIMNYLG